MDSEKKREIVTADSAPDPSSVLGDEIGESEASREMSRRPEISGDG